MTGTLTLDMSKLLHISTSPKFLHRSYSLATIEHVKPLLLKIYLNTTILNVIHKRADHPSEPITFPLPSSHQSQLQHHNKNENLRLLRILFLRRLFDLFAGPDIVSCLAAVATVPFCLAAVSARTTSYACFLLKLLLNSLTVYNILSILCAK